MDNNSKTPVTQLQEYLIRNGMTPQYELIESGIGIHNGTFKYLVTAPGIQAVGAGRSKKEAKHEAAKNALAPLIEAKKLASSLPSNTSPPDGGNMLVPRCRSPSPFEDDLFKNVDDLTITGDKVSYPWSGDMPVGNCVGELQDICMANEIPLATYELTGDVGPPHSKQFTYECLVMMLSVEGVSRTKKQAKQLAAYMMINKLRKTCGDLLCTSSELRSGVNTLVDIDKPCESYKEVINRYKELGSNLRTTKRAPLGLKVAQYHTSLKHLNCKGLEELRNKMEQHGNVLQTLVNPQSVIEEIMEQLQCELSFEPIASLNNDVRMLLSLGTSPEAMLYGSGNTKQKAVAVASLKGLEYLLLMTR